MHLCALSFLPQLRGGGRPGWTGHIRVHTPQHVIICIRSSPLLFSIAARQKLGWEGLGTRLHVVCCYSCWDRPWIASHKGVYSSLVPRPPLTAFFHNHGKARVQKKAAREGLLYLVTYSIPPAHTACVCSVHHACKKYCE